ncbi:radical SAM protein [Candidatus Pyrohabitans sp.]
MGSLLGWELPRTLEIVNNLSRKELLSTSHRCPAEVHPPSDRVEILVNATQECNLACRYCFVNQGRFRYGEERVRRLSQHLAKRLVEVLPEALPWAREFCIHFYGGEPLLNLPAIRAAVDAAASMPDSRFVFAITTNGTICSEEALSVLQKGRFNVILSIDGPAHIHDAVRRTASGKPTHARVLKFLQRLRAGPRLFVRGSSVVRRGWSLREACAYLKTLPVDAIKAQAVRLPSGHPLALRDEERQEYFKHLREIADEVIDSLRRGQVPMDDRFNHRVLQLLRGTRRIAFCGAGRWVFGLAGDGTVLPCALLAGEEGVSLGNINEPGSNWVERGRVWAENHGPRDECYNCWALPLCGGGCPAMLSVCGEDECEMIRANCELALAIYGAFRERPEDLLLLAGVPLYGEGADDERTE